MKWAIAQQLPKLSEFSCCALPTANLEPEHLQLSFELIVTFAVCMSFVFGFHSLLTTVPIMTARKFPGGAAPACRIAMTGRASIIQSTAH